MTASKLSLMMATGLCSIMFSFVSMASGGVDNLDLSDVYYEEEIDEYGKSQRIMHYGIQNTGTLDGTLGARYDLKLDGIEPDEFTFSVLLGDTATEWITLTGEQVEGKENEYMYYLPAYELNSLDKVGYTFIF